MADRDLRLRVIFGAVDKLTAPIRRLQEGARGLSGDIRKTTGELAGLRKAQVRIAQYRAHEEQLRRTAADMAAAAGKTAGLRAEIEAVTRPTAKMTAALEKAERREGMLTSKHDREIAKLKEMTLALEMAGQGVDDLAGHEARLAEKIEAADRRLDAQRSRATQLADRRARGEKLKDLGGKLSGVGAVGSLAVTAPVFALIHESIGAAKESAQAAAAVQASLNSMGAVAGRTLDQLSDQAGRLQDTSLFDDDDIMRQVTTNLLTYGKIHGAVFDQAQQAVVDLSAKTGKDLFSATTMIGKALNDPAKGLTALTRVGVAFDAQQREQIKKMTAAGDVLGAQKIMLAELRKEFAGSAQAARDASPDGQMQQNWRTFQESVGGIALKVLPPLIERAARLLELFNSLDPSVQTFIVGGIALTAALFPVIGVVGGILTVVGGVSAAFSIGFLPAIGIILLVVAAVGVLAYAAYKIYQNWGPIKAWFSALWDGICARVQGAVTWFKSLIPTFKSIGAMMLEGLLSSLNPLTLVAHVLKLGKTAIAAIKGVLGIHSPSRVFAEIGGHMTAGLARGIDGGAGHPVSRVAALGARLTGAAAFGATIAAGGAAPAAAAGARGGGDVHIHIHQQPGEDATALARRVVAEIERLKRQRRDSSYEDQD